MIDYKAGIIPTVSQLLTLYGDAGWTAYTDEPDRLHRAVSSSLFVLTAWEGDQLIGLLRAVGDGETILYIQDLLVLQSYQRRGIGRTLLTTCMERYRDVRQKVLLTDATPKTIAFYRACGFTPAGEYDCTALLG